MGETSAWDKSGKAVGPTGMVIGKAPAVHEASSKRIMKQPRGRVKPFPTSLSNYLFPKLARTKPGGEMVALELYIKK